MEFSGIMLGAALLILCFGLCIAVLYRIVIRQNIPLMKQRFTGEDSSAFGIRFGRILHGFLRGHNLAANRLVPMKAIRSKLEAEFDSFYRGFAYEGTGMGFGARAMLRPGRRGRAFERYVYRLDPAHIYQYYVGLGWWLYSIYRFRPEPYQRWMRTMDPYYAPMLYDGVGFKAALFDYGINASLFDHLGRMGSSALRIGCQGYGRCLWFQCRYEIAPVLSVLKNAPIEVRQDVISGVGLAVAYSLFDNPGRVQGIYRMMPVLYQASFRQGMAFGWEARKRQNKTYWDEMTSTFDVVWRGKMEEGVQVVHLARELAGRHSPETHYVRWMDKTRQLMKDYDVLGGLTCLRS
ncbi:DUF1702 family protein [Paenibacillus cisolokensis]|uniref:DUF1702 family protein n=1 Tax=Paenibacillus cisolokensis TaxID=1658519 RepID=UPI003D2AE3ED